MLASSVWSSRLARGATVTSSDSRLTSEWVEGIPVVWSAPKTPRTPNPLAIWLNGLAGTKEQLDRNLLELSSHGFVAVSFDAWQHGQRGIETKAELVKRVFGQFRRSMWPILGQSVLDTSRVIDWATSRFSLTGGVSMGGFSMGGDIAVAAAGFDPRIDCVAAIIATPDWLRPGMQDASGRDIDQGSDDVYSRFFYDAFNPMTHLAAYSRCPAIAFECGAADQHVPPEAALRFQAALKDTYSRDPGRLRVNLEPGIGHEVTWTAWKKSLDWLLAH
jgi:uncharacterized protein